MRGLIGQDRELKGRHDALATTAAGRGLGQARAVPLGERRGAAAVPARLRDPQRAERRNSDRGGPAERSSLPRVGRRIRRAPGFARQPADRDPGRRRDRGGVVVDRQGLDLRLRGGARAEPRSGPERSDDVVAGYGLARHFAEPVAHVVDPAAQGQPPDPRASGAASPSAETGGARPADRRDCSRFQQFARSGHRRSRHDRRTCAWSEADRAAGGRGAIGPAERCRPHPASPDLRAPPAARSPAGRHQRHGGCDGRAAAALAGACDPARDGAHRRVCRRGSTRPSCRTRS